MTEKMLDISEVKEKLAAQRENPPCFNAIRIKGAKPIQHLF